MDIYDFYGTLFWFFIAFQVPNILFLGRAAAAKGVASFWLNLTGFLFPFLAWAYVIATPPMQRED